MLFSKKKKMKYDTHISFEEKINSIESSEVKQQSYVVDLCEQMVEASKEYEEASKEYQLVTKYLNDVEIIEKFPKEELKELREAAGNVAKLTRDRNLLMNVESKITETQFEQMQGMEAEIPDAIKRLKKNEEYLDVVSKDMKYLEGEKTEWEIMKEDCAKEQKKLRTVSIVLLILFALALAVIAITSYYYIFDTQLTLVILAFFTVLIGTGITIKYQNCTSNIRKSELSKNKAITLENRVKIKYVNTKNAVDYACEKYHVKNSNDFLNASSLSVKTSGSMASVLLITTISGLVVKSPPYESISWRIAAYLAAQSSSVPSITCNIILVRSACPKNLSPRPTPVCAPSIRPGKSTNTNSRSCAYITPNWGFNVVNG